MCEELCRFALLPNFGRVHQIKTQASSLPLGHMLIVCVTEIVLPQQLALLFGHVSEQLEEQGSKNE